MEQARILPLTVPVRPPAAGPADAVVAGLPVTHIPIAIVLAETRITRLMTSNAVRRRRRAACSRASAIRTSISPVVPLAESAN